MGRLVSIAVLVATAFFLSVSPGFSSDAAFESDLLMAYSKSYDSFEGADSSKDVKKPTVSYSIDHDEIVGEHLVFDKKKEGKHINRVDRVGAKYSYAPGRSAVDPMFGDVAYYLTDNSLSGERTTGFEMELPSTLSEVAQIGAAFLTNLVAHEFGHFIVADYAGAKGNELTFFKKNGDKFFLGTSYVSDINSRSILPYTMGGEVFADMTFEHALKSYRKSPSMYNKSLMLLSGTDFLWYCFYAFYVTDGHSSFDPITISKETGLSRDVLFSAVLAKTLMNAYRVYTGEDRIVPYFTVDKYSASLNVAIPFENLWIEKSKMFN